MHMIDICIELQLNQGQDLTFVNQLIDHILFSPIFRKPLPWPEVWIN